MSLIQEALRRRQAETGEPVPVVLVTPPEPPPRAPKPRRGPGLMLTLLLLALLGYGGWFYYLRPPPEAPAKAATQPAAAKPTATNTSLIASLLPSRSNILSRVKATLEAAAQTPDRRELILGDTHPPPSPVTAPATNVPPPSAVKTNTPPQPPSAPTNVLAVVVLATNEHTTDLNAPPPSAPTPKALPLHVNWPKLNVTGIMGRAGGSAVIFINGQILKVGDTIEGARILTIQEHGAQLVLEHETNFFRVGKGTE